jgi:hypothetical protein
MATAALVQPGSPHRGIKALLTRHPLISFFVLAYAGTWLFELRWARAAAIIAMIPLNVCWLFGLPVGIRALVTLGKPEVAETFGKVTVAD